MRESNKKTFYFTKNNHQPPDIRAVLFYHIIQKGKENGSKNGGDTF